MNSTRPNGHCIFDWSAIKTRQGSESLNNKDGFSDDNFMPTAAGVFKDIIQQLSLQTFAIDIFHKTLHYQITISSTRLSRKSLTNKADLH